MICQYIYEYYTVKIMEKYTTVIKDLNNTEKVEERKQIYVIREMKKDCLWVTHATLESQPLVEYHLTAQEIDLPIFCLPHLTSNCGVTIEVVPH